MESVTFFGFAIVRTGRLDQAPLGGQVYLSI